MKEEIKVLKERIAKRNEVLKERALSFQETGEDVNYLEVLFGSSSFGDLVDRVGAVATIAEADRDILKQHELDKKDLEEKQKAVETKLASLKWQKLNYWKFKSNKNSRSKKRMHWLKN